MRVAVVTDIHGNRRALQAVVADQKRIAPDLVAHGGDLVFGGTHPADIIDEICRLGWPGVLGNTDEMLWTQKRPIEMAADEELQKTYTELGVPIVIYGHIHVSFVRQLAGMTVANAGSVSQSYDGDRRAAYALIDGENVTVRRVDYDVESEAKELLRSGLPHAEWLGRILLAGRYCPPV